MLFGKSIPRIATVAGFAERHVIGAQGPARAGQVRCLPGSKTLSELKAFAKKASMSGMGLRTLGSSISRSLLPMLRHTISPSQLLSKAEVC